MHTEKITLPNNEFIDLYFQELHPPEGFDPPGVLAVLQYRKDGKSQPLMEQTFEKMYPRIAKDFAKSLLTSEPSIVGIITPPSSTRQFKPFVEACKALQPNIAVIDEAFQKPHGFKSGNPGTLIDHVRQAFTLDRAKVPVVDPADTICIFDDIYGDGKTTAIVVEKLRPLLPNGLRLVIACPLRLRSSQRQTANPIPTA